MFWKKKEPEKKGERDAILDKRQRWRPVQRTIEECYPEGVKGFEADLKKEPVDAFLGLLDELRVNDKIGMAEQIIDWYLKELRKPEEFVSAVVNLHLRLVRQLEKRGINAGELIKEDWDASVAESKEIIKGVLGRNE